MANSTQNNTEDKENLPKNPSKPQEGLEYQSSILKESVNEDSLTNVTTIAPPSKPIIISGNLSIDLSDSPGYKISNLNEAVAVIKKFYNDGDFQSAKLAIDFAFKLAKKNAHNNDKNLLKDLYLSSANVCGEMKEYPQALKFYEGYHCLSMQLNSNIFTGTEPQHTISLFQFRRFSDYALANLMKSEVTLSRPSAMNDIVDSLIFAWLGSPSFGSSSKHQGHLEAYKKSFEDYRIASFCENCPQKNRFAVQNTLMWAH